MSEFKAPLSVLALTALCAAGMSAHSARADVTIWGALSNFDCPNETDDDCDEFEIELHGPHPEDIYHTYRNSNYGSPQIIGTPTGTIVRYVNPRHRTLPGSIEHFGISLRNFSGDPTPHFAWKHDGVLAGTNPHPLQPQIVTAPGINNEGDPVLIETVTNLDPYNRRMWIKRSVNNVTYSVSLEELMVNDPLVEMSQDLDLNHILLNPGQTVTYQQLEVGDNIASAVINYEVYRDQFIFGQHTMGSYAGTVMNAVVLSTANCSEGGLVITKQPEDVFDVPGATVDFSVSVDNNGDLTDPVFHWFHEGVEIAVTTNDTLTVPNIGFTDAGAYYVQIMNECGTVLSAAARLNMPPQCPTDFDGDGFVTGDDFDAYVAAFEIGDPTADYNADGFVSGDDFDAFVAAFEAGC